MVRNNRGWKAAPGLLFLASLLVGCPGSDGSELAAYLEVVDSAAAKVTEAVARNSPEGAGVCFSSDFFYQEGVPIPEALRDRLAAEGWTLFDQGSQPEPESYMVFLAEPWEDDGERWFHAGYHVSQIHRERVTVWGDTWDFRIRCEGGACRVVESRGRSHYDAASPPVEEYRARDTKPCDGVVPSSNRALSQTRTGGPSP